MENRQECLLYYFEFLHNTGLEEGSTIQALYYCLTSGTRELHGKYTWMLKENRQECLVHYF